MGRAFIAIFKNSACQNGIFAICSLRMLLGHYKRKLQYLQTVQNYHKELPRLSGIIRVHSGRTERTSPITSERFSPQKPMQAHKKLSPVSMRGNSQNGGQTTKSLLIKPQCSGVPIQQAVSLSSSFPRHCLLFVCAFFREMQESAGRKNSPCPRLLHTKPPRLPATETGAVRMLYGYFFQALTQNLARVFW